MTPPPPPPPPPVAYPESAKNALKQAAVSSAVNGGDNHHPSSPPTRLTCTNDCDFSAGPGFTLHRLIPEPQSNNSDLNLTSLILSAFRTPTGPDAEPNDRDSAEDAYGRKVLAQRLNLASSQCNYSLPSYLLYDARGLQLFDALTRLPDNEYYLTKHEADLLATGGVADQVANWIEPGAVIVELGCGSMRKTKVILDAIEMAVGKRGMGAQFAASPVMFYALDMDAGELEKSLNALVANPPNPQGWQFISFHGLIGTYASLMHALPTSPTHAPRLILWLGSSIGNLTRSAATSFMASLRASLHPTDRFLLGVDGRNPPAMIERAYNDPQGLTRAFELNMLHVVNTYLDPAANLFDVDKFEYAGVYNARAGRHEAYLLAVEPVDMVIRGKSRAADDQQLGGQEVRVTFAKGDLMHVEHSYKYDVMDMAKLIAGARWSMDRTWGDGAYSMHLLAPIADELGGFVFDAATASGQGVPSVDEWEQVWRAFDMMSLKLVKSEAWELRPIEVRLPVCFYVGHLPCFADIHIARVFDLPLLASTRYANIFERGMDPDLDDPTQCHTHSEVPDTWPAMADICAYRDKVRARIRAVTAQLGSRSDGAATAKDDNGEARKVLCMVFEHDLMHLETLMYMIAQFPTHLLNNAADIGLPSASVRMAGQANGRRLEPATTRLFPAARVTLGRSRQDKGSVWGWDNEFPEHDVQEVGPVEVQARQVSVGEYAAFLDAHMDRKDFVPAGWIKSDENQPAGGWQVRSIAHNTYLSIDRNEEQVANWPVCVSKVMAQAYAKWLNNTGNDRSRHGEWRLPTEHELRMIFDSAPLIDPSTTGFSGLRLAPMPMSVAASPEKAFAYAGNVWEWTASPFLGQDGFVADQRYPGYSADFFDGKHSVVLGASWATHPRLANRSTFRNWFQDGYPYAQIGFRLVRSV
ncbi:hypothetical protein BCR44DRAFT_124925 [Catenaria anguillulae PL171]|uniref:C-type lectin protein n=1 Tax=Catenaria anguillulae PL171 TaxID=765915 RepID=A0A1Y2HKI6_9FUNG|nr:hypothetical protein BCR44DRAFT_124925 [Catenaria anguillulae PL171]